LKELSGAKTPNYKCQIPEKMTKLWILTNYQLPITNYAQ